MKKNFAFQLRCILEQKFVYVTFLILLALIMVHYFSGTESYNGFDIVTMYNPTVFLSISGCVDGDTRILQLLPLLIVLPAAFSYVIDRNSKIQPVIFTRTTAGKYYLAKSMAVFLVTFLTFVLPFLIELGLYCIKYPVDAAGITNDGVFSDTYKIFVSGMMTPWLFALNVYVNAIVNILVIGATCGIVAVFAMAVSTFVKKFWVIVFLPIFILFYGLAKIGEVLETKYSMNYVDYFTLYSYGQRKFLYFFLIMAVLLIISVVILCIESRKDWLE